MTRAGFAAVVGAPNAGKSTLVNRLVGAKVSIVTRKVQTTRFPIRGVAMEGDSQIVLVDTPGIFAPRRRLDRAMVGAAIGGARDADVVVHLVDAARPPAENREARLIAEIAQDHTVLLALNKVDLVPATNLLPVTERLFGAAAYAEAFMISALQGSGVADLKVRLAALMPVGPFLYPPDQCGDLPERVLAAEVTREMLYERVHQELPYAAGVETTAFEDQRDGSARIEQTIFVERDGQRAIVIGKGGRTLRWIGEASRRELGRMLGRKVHLFLYVKVNPDWAEDRGLFTAMGLDFDA